MKDTMKDVKVGIQGEKSGYFFIVHRGKFQTRM